MRKLASIQVIESLSPIPGADNIELAQVLGWKVVVKKGDFRPGDWCVYFEVDSILPEREWSEFLRKQGFRVRVWKLNKFGVISQGLALKEDILPLHILRYNDRDVTDLLNITKWEREAEALTAGDNDGSFPYGVPKTDEIRLQSIPWVLDKMYGKPYYASVKYDGTSATYIFRDGKLEVASRNWRKKDGDNVYWKIAHQHNLAEELSVFQNFAFQGEICGPGIQKNPLGLNEYRLYIFNVFDVTKQQYMDRISRDSMCAYVGLETVETWILGSYFYFSINELEYLASIARYPGNRQAEGIIVRPQVPETDFTLGQLSFKVISPEYLLRGD